MDSYNAAAWLLDRNVASGRGEHVGLRYQGAGVTYAGLLPMVWRVQHALDQLGTSPGTRVVLVMNDSPDMVAWFLGCLRSAVIPVPISTMLKSADVAAIAADAGAELLVLSDEHLAHLPAARSSVSSLTNVVAVGAGDVGAEATPWSSFDDVSERPVAPTTADSPAFWLYSSGTTGRPKGVMHRHGSPQATFDTYASQVLHVGADDRFLSVAKLFFAYGLGNSLTFPFGAGATAVLEPGRPTPPGIADLVRQERPTLFFASPGFVAALLDADLPDDTFASVRATVTAGESLPAELHRRFTERFGHPVLDGIGSTEALHIFCSNRLDRQQPGSSGWVVPGYAAKLLDDEGVEVTAADTPGYLHVQGPSVASGYWEQPEATAAAFLGDWLRTGDVYTRSSEGTWTFLGRNSDMIKAGGIWVSPAEVESTLITHPDVLEVAVVGARDDHGLEETVAFVVPRSGHTVDLGSLDAHCREHMASFKRPRRVLVVEELPKTATGKIQRFQLREQLAADRAQAG